ncbi:MAG: hypothetical protein IJN07_06335 [Clostridia bacterium]|nr:hypothetical protein [Clostridia bacterium]
MERINFLRKQVFENLKFSNEFHYLFYKNYEQHADLSEEERYAEAFFSAFSKLTPSITEGELIVGKRDIPLCAGEQQEWVSAYKSIAEARRKKAGNGQDSHMAIDYELILSKGILGIIKMIDEYLLNCNKEKESFYKCCKRCLQAVIKHSENYADLALKMSEQANDPIRQSELKKIAEICKKVPAGPAESFYEAVQSVHFITHCLSLNPFRTGAQQFQLGHPDRYLLPFFEKDIQNGTITKEYAQLLLDCLGIQINMRVPSGLSSGYMVGGRDEHGNIVANELTEICMQVIDDIRLVYPAVGLCYTEGMPEKYLDKACKLLSKGYSHPAIFNDDVITKGLIHYGVPMKQARNYIHSTCVEITPVASSNVWVASPYTNMPQLLLELMNKEYSTFDALLNAYFEKLDAHIKSNFEAENHNRSVRAQNSINPLLSCFVNDCLQKGVDIERGGAKYNWITPSFVGMANLVDSLYAIKTLVFDEKKLTLCEFRSILESNFEGNESLRFYILNRIPKYGNDLNEIDQYFSFISEHIASECKKYSGLHSNSNLIPSVFCWVMHERFGRETSATPDGRKAGFPLGDGSGPCQGRELNGPTASVLSSTKWDHSKFIGGVAVNLKFSKASLGVKSLDTMISIIKTYLKRGGFEVQINVVDNETLKKAQQNPEGYQDLVVRIGGYSDYFVRLSPEMQEEVILRTTHNV